MAQKLHRASRLIATLLLPPIVLVAVLGKWVLRAFGSSYAAHSYGILLLFVIVAVPDAVTNVYVTVLRARQEPHKAAAMNIGMGVVALGGAWYLMGVMGVVGAAWAWALAQAVGCAYVAFDWRQAKRRGSSAPVPVIQTRGSRVVVAEIAAKRKMRTRFAEHRLTWHAFAALPLWGRRQLLFFGYLRRIGHLRRPRTFNEKVNWRILNDRREILAWTCDKLRTKAVAEKLGINVVPTLWAGTDVRELASMDLPPHWVLKPNNRTGLVFFGQSRAVDFDAIHRLSQIWESDTRVIAKGEWAYTRADPGFLVEERIGPIPGAPTDYKVFVFDGVPYMISVDQDRFVNHLVAYYSPEWQLMPFRDKHQKQREAPRPECLDEILEVASTVAAGFDFLRVDLYDENGRVYLGEVTPYSGAGLEPFLPRSADLEVGSVWRLPDLRS
jgi:hypothetical protein